MNETLYWEIAGIVILLGFAAFFSGSETAYFSLSRAQLKQFSHENKRASKLVVRLLSDHQRLLATILVGNTLVNVTIASLAALVFGRIPKGSIGEIPGLVVEMLIVGLLILVVGEIAPKTFAVSHSRTFALDASYPMEAIVTFGRPVSGVILKLMRMVTRFLKGETGELITIEELRTVLELGEKDGAIEKGEKEMIRGVFSMEVKSAKDVMVPRADMVCLDVGTKLSEAIEIVKEVRHSRIPVFEGTLERIVGVLQARDLIRYLYKDEPETTVGAVMRECHFVPTAKKIDELLRELQREKVQMAIVVNEYGRTAGLVTIEDLLEEIVGEIHDEYDEEEPAVTVLEDGSFLVRGNVELSDVSRMLGLDVSDPKARTVEEFISLFRPGVPEEGEELLRGGARFVVEKVVGRKVWSARIERVNK
ncbi:MAG: hemolysin family protein [Candidatus Eisenbacteria bacterium]|nr:hemolysin family protein [Candidatus Eisenbacteria bacterium]